jgi:superfamily I DNA/RNA helicase
MKGYPGELLAVMAPKKASVARIWGELHETELAPFLTVEDAGEHLSFSSTEPICICSLHAAKGLEFRAVHIVNCEELRSFGLNRNLIYTGVTRTKTSLSLYCSGKINS